MASIGESSSTSPKCSSEKPVIVRVKRKSSQSPIDALWLEINERPSKRALLDLQKLSIRDELVHNEESFPEVKELKKKKVFVQHVETVTTSDATVDLLQSFVPTSSVEGTSKIEERKQNFKKDNKQEQLLSKARQCQKISAQNARFEQIWRSRTETKDASSNKALHDMCHFFDVVRVDAGERSSEMQEQETMTLEDQKTLSSYLPLLREFIPSAAADIESDLHDYMSKPDDYVYDYYTVRDDMDMGDDEDDLSPFPLVQVEDEDFYDGPDDESEYDSEDSNAEHHPRNDYPDEASDEEDKEETETSSSESEEGDDASSGTSEFDEWIPGLSEDAVPWHEDGTYNDYDNTYDYEDDNVDFDDDISDDGEGWR